MAFEVSSQLVGNTRLLVAETSANAKDANGNIISVSASVSAVADYSNVYSAIVSNLVTLNQHSQNVVINLQEINSHLLGIKTHINELTMRANTRSLGIYTQEANTPFTKAQSRALAVAAVKESGGINNLTAEINSPTPLPGDEA